jgi:L-fuculose-phosphate aldolase
MSADKLELVEHAQERLAELPEQVIATARALRSRNLVVGTVGNVSARVPGGFLITPTRMPYEDMRPAHLVRLTLDGTARGPGPMPSSEWRLHCAIYRARPHISAIVHTHSVHATAWSFQRERLEPRLEESRYYDIGPLRTSPPVRAGSRELGQVAVRALSGSRAALLGNHGVISVGGTLDEALICAEVVEREAQVAWLLRSASRGPVHRRTPIYKDALTRCAESMPARMRKIAARRFSGGTSWL